MKAKVFIATSIDGFIAREDGGIDWLPGGDAVDGDEDYGYQAFMDSVDALVMGRNTYDLVSSFDIWPYGDKPVVVLSNRPVSIPAAVQGTAFAMSAPPHEVVRSLSARGFEHLYVDGGRTIQAFLKEGLIHEMIITRVPILIGSGIPLFGPLEHDVRLVHLDTRHFPSGLVQSRYQVVGGG